MHGFIYQKAFCYSTLCGNVIQFRREKSSDEGVSIDSSKMDLAALFWNFTSKFVSSLSVFPRLYNSNQDVGEYMHYRTSS